MSIWCENSKWHSKLYDKKIAMIDKGLKINKFPHPESKLSTRCKYGVITSQLHRYNVACTEIKHFLVPATKLYKDYVDKGFVRSTMDKYFERFMRFNVTQCKAGTVKRRFEQQTQIRQ